MVNLHKVWNQTRIELATPGTAVSIEKNDSVNMHKAAESYSVNAADILGWLHDILRFFNNCLKIIFISKWKKSNVCVHFTTFNAGPDITPIVLLSNRRLRIKI